MPSSLTLAVKLAALVDFKVEVSLVYQARPISLAYWKLELGHREKRERSNRFY